MTEMPLQLQKRLSDKLDIGECVLWTGRPVPKWVAIRLVPAVLLGLFVTAFMVFWMGSAAGWTLPSLPMAPGIRWLGVLFALLWIPGLLMGLRLVALPLSALRQLGAHPIDIEPEAATPPKPARATGRGSRTIGSPRGQILLGLFFTGIAGVSLVIFGQTHALVCTRVDAQRVDGVIHRTWMGVIPLADQPIGGLQKARLRESSGTGRRSGIVYTITLHTASGQVPLGFGSSGGIARKHTVVRQINAFLADAGATTLSVERQSAGAMIFVPVILVAAGLFVAGKGIRTARSQQKRAALVVPGDYL